MQEDIRLFSEGFDLEADLADSSFCITGATGLIGSILTKCLLALKQEIKITLPVRSKDKAFRIYGDDSRLLRIAETVSLEDWIKKSEVHFDYVVHCASPTAGKYMTENPVETFNLTYQTTYHLLNHARKYGCKGFVYLSSLEYYGDNNDDRVIDERMQGYVNPTSTRSSYPMAKRAAEYLCYAFAEQYGVPAKVARLTQTFGAGVAKDDNRVFAQFARSIIKGEDIVLHTKGDSAKPYCYTTDCVSAILYILLRGQNGEAYNVANEETYISIRGLADFLRDEFNPNINVVVEEHLEMGYAPVTKLHLSSAKLIGLGWRPNYGLKEMFERLMIWIMNN